MRIEIILLVCITRKYNLNGWDPHGVAGEALRRVSTSPERQEVGKMITQIHSQAFRTLRDLKEVITRPVFFIYP